MADEPQELPATEVTADAVSPATGAGKDEIAGQLKSALGSPEAESMTDNSPREQMRRQIEAELSKQTEKPTEAKPTGERPRAPDGKFAPKDAATNTDAPAADAPTSVAAPTSWKKELQGRWNEIPPDLQAEIARRESDVTKGFEKYQGLRVHEPVLDFANQIAPRLNTTGPQLVHQWAQAQEALMDPARKRQAIEYLAKTYGVDLAPPAQTAPQGQPQPGQAPAQPEWVDPAVTALQQKLDQLEDWKTNLEWSQQEYQRQQAQQVQSAKMSAIDQFASEKGTDGQPLRPHLETVMPDMAAGIARIKAANPQISDQDALQQAYDNAVWGNPTTREAVMQAQKIAEERERTDKARQRAQAATRGAVSPATASPQGPPASAPLKGDIRDQMRSVYEQIAG